MKYREGIVVGLDPVEFFKQELQPEETKIWFPKLLDLDWEQVEWTANRKLPRWVCRPQRAENPVIKYLMTLIEEIFETAAIGVWCNWYRSGKDWTPEHQDKYGAHVFTYSFGAPRNFYFKNMETGKKSEYLLEDGDLMYFSPEHDSRHKHCVPKSSEDGDRISVVIFTEAPYSRRHRVMKPTSVMPVVDKEVMVKSFIYQLERLNKDLWASFLAGETLTLDVPDGKIQFRTDEGDLLIW